MKSSHWLVMTSALAQLACSCIARGAKVKTPRGDRSIEELAVGDEVVVVDPQTLEEHVAKISAVTSARRECSLINSLKLTSAHPLFDTQKNEWAPAGDWILGERTEFASIDGPQTVALTERFVGVDDVFDLSVDHPLHTFVADGVVVHNKKHPGTSCASTTGDEVLENASCVCPLGVGTVDCSNGVATCNCSVPPTAQVSTFYRSQWFVLGDTDRALIRADGPSRLRCGPSPRALTVVGSETVGWFPSESVLALRGTDACFIDVDLVPSDSGSTWGHLWFRNTSRVDGLVRIGDTVLLEVDDFRVMFKPTFDANGAPAPQWFSTNSSFEWQRYEWQLEFLTPTTYRFWPRLRTARGETIDATQFGTLSPDGAGISLDEWYAAGNAFSFADETDGGVRVISLGQDAREALGTTTHVASFMLSNEGWLAGPEEK